MSSHKPWRKVEKEESYRLEYMPSSKLVDSFERLQANEEDDTVVAALLAADSAEIDRPESAENVRWGWGRRGRPLGQRVPIPGMRSVLADMLSLFQPPPMRRRGSGEERGKEREEEAALEERLKKFGLARQRVAGDGNCQFRAVAQQVFGSGRMHRVVRGLVVEELRKHSPRYRTFVAGDYGVYVERMARSGCWGDHVSLQAAATSLKVEVHLVTSALLDSHAHVIVSPFGVQPVREIWLSYLLHRHYDSLYSSEAEDEYQQMDSHARCSIS